MALRDRINRVMDHLDSLMPAPRVLMKLANTSGVAFFWVTSIVVVSLSVFVTIPAVWSNEDGSANSGGQTATWVLLFFAANMFLNYLRSVFVTPFYDAGKLNVPTAEGGKNWGYCVPCQQYIPPRAHHCPVCNRCVLKRESHCFFIGYCIGHANERFFVVYCFYTALTSFCSFLYFATYLNHEIGPIISRHAPEYLLPFAALKWTSGTFSTEGVVTLILFYITLMAGAGCTLLFCHQMNLILRGQTGREMMARNNEYDAGAQMNLREVFGAYWWLCFLLPVKFQQPADGITWSRLKNIKRY